MTKYRTLAGRIGISGNSSQELPTHFVHRDTGSVMWNTMSGWNRICVDGTVSDRHRITSNPANDSSAYEPRFGPFTITLGE